MKYNSSDTVRMSHLRIVHKYMSYVHIWICIMFLYHIITVSDELHFVMNWIFLLWLNELNQLFSHASRPTFWVGWGAEPPSGNTDCAGPVQNTDAWAPFRESCYPGENEDEDTEDEHEWPLGITYLYVFHLFSLSAKLGKSI